MCGVTCLRYGYTSGLSLLEKTVLCFDIKLINAHLEHFKTPGPLLKEK